MRRRCACVAAVRHSDAQASLARGRVRKSDADDVAAAPRCETATESASNQRCNKGDRRGRGLALRRVILRFQYIEGNTGNSFLTRSVQSRRRLSHNSEQTSSNGCSCGGVRGRVRPGEKSGTAGRRRRPQKAAAAARNRCQTKRAASNQSHPKPRRCSHVEREGRSAKGRSEEVA